MTEEQARTIYPGDKVRYGGEERTVTSVQVKGIAAPLFRLVGVEDGLTSYRLCGFVGDETDEEDEQAKPKVQLTGTDGNVFALLWRCTSALKRAGQGDRAEALTERVMQAESYDRALQAMLEFVDAS